MKTSKPKFSNADEYIAMFPGNVREILQQVRSTIKKTAPGAQEVISYQMPAFKLDGMLVWYAANKEHIGFYPTPSPIKVFKKELENYKTSKGAIQFPLDKSIPLKLIKDIVKFRINEDSEKAERKLRQKAEGKRVRS
jgi:uncharacterized protein YdhG (YjbR/CyaY superfamily)